MLDEIIIQKIRHDKISDMSGIYGIRNLVNNKIYIGSAINFRKRKNSHFSALKKNKHHNIYLQRAYNKYGDNNFLFFVIEFCDNAALIDREQFYLDQNKSAQREYGYNIREIASDYGTCSAETKSIISSKIKKRYRDKKYDFCGICGSQKERYKTGQKYCRNCKNVNLRKFREKVRAESGKLDKEKFCRNGHDRSTFGFVIKIDNASGLPYKRCNECYRITKKKLADKHKETYIPKSLRNVDTTKENQDRSED
jgi:group I intron endonuclease